MFSIPLQLRKALLIGACLLVLLGFTSSASANTEASALPKALTPGAYQLDPLNTLYILQFSLGHSRYETILPSKTLRSSQQKDNVVSYVLKTAEGLRTNEGLAASVLLSSNPGSNAFQTKPDQKHTYTLLVLHQKSTSTSRTNTMAITGLPFSLIDNGSTTTTRLTPNELKRLQVSDSNIKPLKRIELTLE